MVVPYSKKWPLNACIVPQWSYIPVVSQWSYSGHIVPDAAVGARAGAGAGASSGGDDGGGGDGGDGDGG
jgi:hypothetical protein